MIPYVVRMLGMVILLVALTACGSTKVGKNADGDSTLTITGNDGEKVTFTTGQEGKLPDGFPLPLIKGGKVGSATKITTNNKDGYSVELTYSGTHKEAADFYQKALKDLDIEVERTDVSAQDEVTIMLMGQSDKHDVWLMVNGKGEKGGTIAIMWGDK